MCLQIAGFWSIQCVVSALQVLHVARAMIFPCKEKSAMNFVSKHPCKKKKCHVFCFEANCERRVVSRNMVDKTAVLMSNSNMWIRISRSTRGRVDTGCRKLWHETVQIIVTSLMRALTRPSTHSYST